MKVIYIYTRSCQEGFGSVHPEQQMTPMSFLAQTPFWVWPLFALLIALGLRASRTRRSPALLVYAMPALWLISVNTLLRLPQPGLVIPAHLVGYAIGAAAGLALQKRWILEKSAGSVLVKGEWLTLATMMTLFLANFVNGLVATVAPALQASGVFLALFAAFTDMASGTFGGRAVRLAITPATA